MILIHVDILFSIQIQGFKIKSPTCCSDVCTQESSFCGVSLMSGQLLKSYFQTDPRERETMRPD